MKKTLSALILILMIGCTSVLVKTPEFSLLNAQRSPSAQNQYGYYILEDPLQKKSNDLTFIELENILKQNKFSKIEDLLKFLSETKPEYMSHYTLGFESQSLHESSKEFPRAIVYGKTGRFIITFNGHKKQDAYEMLEVVEFNPTKNIFEYREIEFNEFKQLRSPYTISKIDGPLIDSETSKCLQCHTERRPIWNAYDKWPGFYGGDDDFPITSSAKRGLQSSLGLPYPANVKNDWQSFKKNHGRYQFLPEISNSAFLPELGPRPNADLTIALSQLNGYRIGQLVKDAGGDVSTAAAMVFAMDCQARRDIGSRSSKIADLIYGDSQRTKEAVTNFNVGLALRLMKDQKISIDQYQNHWTAVFKNVGESSDYIFNRESAGDILKSHLNSGYTSGLRPEFSSFNENVAATIAVARSLVPGAKIEKWPTNSYEDVHIYENGIDPQTAIRRGLVKSLVPVNLKASFEPPENPGFSFSNYCGKLRSMMPSELQN